MKVSVSLTTYNHAPYIGQAIESVLMQQTNFDFELLIGEDDSNDGTREIVKEYAAKFPGKIRLFLHDRKDVIYINGKPTGRRNMIHNLKATQGQYVALLDGDDYWSTPDKLQKQADLLDQHPEYAMCFHGMEVLNQADGRRYPFKLGLKKNRHTLEDWLRSECHIQKASVMIRNRLFPDFPDWYWKVSFGDLPLYLLVAEHGDIGFLDEVMGVYRIHAGGLWSQGADLSQWTKPESKASIWRLMGMVDFYEAANQHLGLKYDRMIREKISMWCYALVWACRLQDNRAQMKLYLRKALKAKAFNSDTPPSFVFKSLLHAYLPFVYASLAWLKKTQSAGKKS